MESSPRKKYRFHLLGLVHLPCSREYMSCAFTQKNYKLAQMLLSLGHEVIYYGAEGSTVPCTEFVQTHSLKEIREAWGDGDNRFDIGYDWKSQAFRHDFNTKPTPTTIKYYFRATREILNRKRDDDFVLVTQGVYQKPITDKLGLYLTVEPGIGYRGSFAAFRAFESSYMQNFTYGGDNPRESINGNYYDRVIPNYFDPKDFEISPEKGDYYLYIGRMIIRKGVWTAVKATEAIGAKLILAGQVDPEINVNDLPSHCKFIGSVGAEQRKHLMSRAIATFVPTIYLEPFAGVHIESMLSGTPPITTNFGVFPETIPDHLDGKVGFRCNTLQDFVDAAQIARIQPASRKEEIREYAERFTMNEVARKYQRWFDDLYQVYKSTIIPGEKGWHYLRG